MSLLFKLLNYTLMLRKSIVYDKKSELNLADENRP